MHRGIGRGLLLLLEKIGKQQLKAAMGSDRTGSLLIADFAAIHIVILPSITHGNANIRDKLHQLFGIGAIVPALD